MKEQVRRTAAGAAITSLLLMPAMAAPCGRISSTREQMPTLLLRSPTELCTWGPTSASAKARRLLLQEIGSLHSSTAVQSMFFRMIPTTPRNPAPNIRRLVVLGVEDLLPSGVPRIVNASEGIVPNEFSACDGQPGELHPTPE